LFQEGKLDLPPL